VPTSRGALSGARMVERPMSTLSPDSTSSVPSPGQDAADVIERHFAAENAHDVAATLATYTDDVVWDDVAHPACPVRGKDATALMYEGIMVAIPDLHLESITRFATGDHVIDESLATGHVLGSFLGVDGGGASVSFRMLHVFDLRDGLISREQAWFDTAGVLRQIAEHAAAVETKELIDASRQGEPA
jgi:steroid delta-isomerase-like uncharacterized protein